MKWEKYILTFIGLVVAVIIAGKLINAALYRSFMKRVDEHFPHQDYSHMKTTNPEDWEYWDDYVPPDHSQDTNPIESDKEYVPTDRAEAFNYYMKKEFQKRLNEKPQRIDNFYQSPNTDGCKKSIMDGIEQIRKHDLVMAEDLFLKAQKECSAASTYIKTTQDLKNNLLSHKAALHFLNGSRYYEKHQFDKAIEEFKKTLKLNPEYLRCQNILANTYFVMGDAENAIFYYRKIAETYRKMGEYEKAKEIEKIYSK